MLDVYGVRGPVADDLIQVARDARLKGWWHLYGTVLTSAYVGLEAAASSIRTYEALVVPGLLQVPEYGRAMIEQSRADILHSEVERRIHVRHERQSLLTQNDPLHFWVVLDEAVFHRMVGGPGVMRSQLTRLIDASTLPNVKLQVLPFAEGAHPGMDGSFSILQYEEAADPDVVFAENAAGGLFLEKDEDLHRYHQIFDALQAKALPPAESATFIAALAKEL